MDNQRFKKLCRLPQLGVYVDEAHHLFGADLEKQIRKKTANKTSLRDTINMLAERTSIVACYNYTGTPYVNKQVLPEVVYAYGLRESIWNGYLKDADPIAFENVKDTEFLRMAVTTFWERYGGKTYEGLNPKLAIYASRVEEAVNEVRPALEEILADLGIPASSILVNVGETKYTKDEDIRNFNDLDVQGSQGNEKQFIILVDKGKEGWNCRSLFGVAMFRNPNSKIFVLQLLLGRKGCDKMAKPTLAEKDILNPSETIKFFNLSNRKFYKFLGETDGGDFLAYYKERKLILRVAFEKYLMLNPEIKEELANGESRQRKNKA